MSRAAGLSHPPHLRLEAVVEEGDLDSIVPAPDDLDVLAHRRLVEGVEELPIAAMGGPQRPRFIHPARMPLSDERARWGRPPPARASVVSRSRPASVQE
jgi:hypothetical protein